MQTSFLKANHHHQEIFSSWFSLFWLFYSIRHFLRHLPLLAPVMLCFPDSFQSLLPLPSFPFHGSALRPALRKLINSGDFNHPLLWGVTISSAADPASFLCVPVMMGPGMDTMKWLRTGRSLSPVAISGIVPALCKSIFTGHCHQLESDIPNNIKWRHLILNISEEIQVLQSCKILAYRVFSKHLDLSQKGYPIPWKTLFIKTKKKKTKQSHLHCFPYTLPSPFLWSLPTNHPPPNAPEWASPCPHHSPRGSDSWYPQRLTSSL